LEKFPLFIFQLGLTVQQRIDRLFRKFGQLG
jgi:hypothetical protein